MMLSATKLTIILLLSLMKTEAVKPPGYREPTKDSDPNPPQYEYGYNIENEKGTEQGKQEQRDGIYASGRYYVQGKESNQDVRYFADDWGYHPAVEYSSVGPNSRSSAKFALGHEAVQQLKNKENNLPQLQGLPETGNLDEQGRISLQKLQEADQRQIKNVQQQPTVLQFTNSQNSPLDNIDGQQIPQQVQIYSEPQLEIQQNQEQQISQSSSQQDTSIQQSSIGQSSADSSHQQYFIQQEAQPQHLSQQIFTQQHLPGQESIIQSTESHNTNAVASQEQVVQVVQHIKEPVENLIFPQVQQQFSNEQVSIDNHQFQQQQGELFIQNHIIHDQENSQNKQNLQEVVQQEKFPNENNVIEPQRLVQLDDYMNEFVGQNNFQEFGLKINVPKNENPSQLVESTQHLVSGQDVLDINEAITNYQETSISTNSQDTVVTDYKTSDVTSVPTTTPATTEDSSLNGQPIVVADSVETNIVSSTSKVELNQREEAYSTTANSVVSISSTISPSIAALVVTPRPVSTKFLAPLTAGIRLQSVDHHREEQNQGNKYNVRVEIQESVPYYLGKYEYPLGYGQEATRSNSSVPGVDEKAKENINLGTTLLYFPGDVSLQNNPVPDVDNHITVQQLPSTLVKEQFLEIDQQQAQGYQHQVAIQQGNQIPQEVKVIREPYPVNIPYGVPYPVVKQVEIPRTVQKIVEKPVHITRYVEKPIGVPQPYPVEKVIEKPVHIPVQVTKYIDRPYPVEVRVPYPQPYPVDRVVQKIVKQPYPVEVRVPVERIVEKKVPVPHYIEKHVPVEKIVEKPVHHYVDRPYPVEVKVPVEKVVEKPVPHYVERPYPVEVKVPVPQPYYVRVEVPKPYPVPVHKYIERPQVLQGYPLYHSDHSKYAHKEQHVQQSQPQIYFIPNPYAYAPQINQYIPPKKQLIVNNGYLPPKQISIDYSPPKQLQTNHGYLPPQQTNINYSPPKQSQTHNGYLPPKQDNYGHLPTNEQGCGHQADSDAQHSYDNVGLLPPKVGDMQKNLLRRYRTARSHFDDTNIRMEYGFLPPLVPSLEIDDQGNPIEKSEK